MNDILQGIEKRAAIYFVRHAESRHNAAGLMAGRMETPLTSQGVAQAECTATYLVEREPTLSAILHSPIGRAEHTARIIHNAYQAALHFEACAELEELDVGMFEDKSIVDIQKQHPHHYSQFVQKSWEAVPQAERITSLIARARSVWRTIAEFVRKGHTTLVLVSHGGFMQWLFKTSFGFSGEHVDKWAPIVKISNCGLFCLKVEPLHHSEEHVQSGHAQWTLTNLTTY